MHLNSLSVIVLFVSFCKVIVVSLHFITLVRLIKVQLICQDITQVKKLKTTLTESIIFAVSL